MARRNSYTEREIYNLVHSEQASSLPPIVLCLLELVFQQEPETDGKNTKRQCLVPLILHKDSDFELTELG